MLSQKNNAVNPSRDLFVLNKSVNKIRAFNAAIPSDFSTVSKPDAARIKKEALELVNLISYALNQRALKIDVLDDEKKRIETTKHVSIVYYALNLIASQLETTARAIAEKLETEPTTTEPETEPTETNEPAETTEKPRLNRVEYHCLSFGFGGYGANNIQKYAEKFTKLSRAKKDVATRYETTRAAFCKYCKDFAIVYRHANAGFYAKTNDLENDKGTTVGAWEIPLSCAKYAEEYDDDAARRIAGKVAKELDDALNGREYEFKHAVNFGPWNKYAMVVPAELKGILPEPKQEQETAPAVVSEGKPAPLPTVESKQATPAPAPDNRNAIINETFDAITKRIIKASEAVPYMLEKSIKEGCPLWSQKWFSFAELPRKYFDGTLYSVNNMVLMGFHAGFYISESEARRLLGAKIKPDARAIARRVLMPVFKDAKTPNKKELDALRNCEPIADETKTRRPDFYRVEKVYDQSAFKGLSIKKSRELPNNENARNARAEKVLREFCAANNIIFSAVLGLGQAVCEHVENPAAPIKINVPDISQFKSSTAYYSVVFHECTHAANRRNGCQLTKNREELAAEIGACIVLNSLGFDPAEYIDDSGAYVRKFKDTASEKNAIKKAWKYAQASALLILKSFIDDAIRDDDTPKQEPKQEQETPAQAAETVETENTIDSRNYDVEEIQDVIETLEHLAIVADTLDGRDVEANERRDAQEKTARELVKEARENETVNASQLDSYEKDIDRINTEYPPKRIEDGLVIRRNPDGSESWLSKNGTELMRDITNAH